MRKHKGQKTQRHKSAGFTLTEVVVASTLLIIAIVPILKALTTAHLSSTIIEHKTKSLTLAQAKLNEIKAYSIYNYSNSYQGKDIVLEGSYLCNVLDVAVETDLRQLTVAVGYDTSSDSKLDMDETEVTLSIYLARRW